MSRPPEGTERLGELFRSRSGVAREACPEPDRLWEAAHDRASAPEVRRLIEHTAVCAACATAWRLARDFGEAERRAAGPTLAPRSWVRVWAPVGVAAVLLLAAALFLVDDRRSPTEPIYRVGEHSEIRPLVPEGAALPRAAFRLTWSLEAESPVYSIRVLDEELNLLASGRHLTDAAYHVPAPALEGLADGATILWQIDALLPDGRRLRSPTFVTRIATAGPS